MAPWFSRVQGTLGLAWRFARSELMLLAAVAVIAGGTLLFIEVADETGGGDSAAMDRYILLAFREPTDLSQPRAPRWVTRTMIDVTSIGGIPVLSLLTVLLTGFFVTARNYTAAILTIASVFGAMIVMTLLKNLFERTRPDVVPHLVEVSSASFPSGHAMVSTAAYLTLGVILAQARSRRIGAYVMACAALISLLISMSRVYLGVHYPTDVLAGWCAGAVWAMGCCVLTYRVIGRRADPVRETYQGAGR